MRCRIALLLAALAALLPVGAVSAPALATDTTDVGRHISEIFQAAIQSPPGDYLSYRDQIVGPGDASIAGLSQIREPQVSWLESEFAKAMLQRILQPTLVGLLDDEFSQIESLGDWGYGRRGSDYQRPHDSFVAERLSTSRIAKSGSQNIPFLLEKLFKQPLRDVPDRTVIGHHQSNPRGAASALLYIAGGKRAARAVAVHLLTDATPDRILSAARLTDDQLGARMIPLLSDDARKAWAAWVLGELRDARAVGPLVATLTDYNVYHRYASEALIKIGAPAIPALTRALWGKRLETQSWAIGALGGIGEAALPALERAYEAGADIEGFRRVVVSAVAGIRAPRVVPFLTRALKSPDRAVRAAAAGALAEHDSERTKRILLAALANPENHNSAVLPHLASALVQLKEPRAVEPLVALVQDKDQEVRTAAIQGLGQIGDARAVPALLKCLRHDDPRTRFSAASALGNIGDPTGISGLRGALRDSDAIVRSCAAEALGQMKAASALHDLIAALSDTAPRVQSAAGGALGSIGDRRAVQPLIGALGHEDHYVRSAAAEALGRIGDSRAVGSLIAALDDKEGNVQYRATLALGAIHDARAVDALRQQAHAKRSVPAAMVLADMGDMQAVEPLIQAFQSWERMIYRRPGPANSAKVATALGKLGDARAIDVLIDALRDWDGDLRHSAAAALERITGQTFGEDVTKWREWRNQD